MMHNLLAMTRAPSVPASLRNSPTKYNIITRLWTIGFWRLLESLRRAACATPRDMVAFEHLQDFIYYAYGFYAGLVEEHTLDVFRQSWLECLGDLARYRMTVAAMANNMYYEPSALTSAALHAASEDAKMTGPRAAAIPTDGTGESSIRAMRSLDTSSSSAARGPVIFASSEAAWSAALVSADGS
jgi:protein SMG6